MSGGAKSIKRINRLDVWRTCGGGSDQCPGQERSLASQLYSAAVTPRPRLTAPGPNHWRPAPMYNLWSSTIAQKTKMPWSRRLARGSRQWTRSMSLSPLSMVAIGWNELGLLRDGLPIRLLGGLVAALISVKVVL